MTKQSVILTKYGDIRIKFCDYSMGVICTRSFCVNMRIKCMFQIFAMEIMHILNY